MILTSVFLSDLHLGSRKAEPETLISFFNQLHCQTLYLVGDIIDGWKLEQRWLWPQSYTLVFDALLKLRDRGTKIIYITGNHDEKIRLMGPVLYAFFKKQHGIEILHRKLHITANNHKIIVLHGDQFDRSFLKNGMSRFSDKIINWLAERLGFWQHATVLIKGEKRKFSLSKMLRKSGYQAVKMISRFESAVANYLKENDVDGLICGHTHIPVVKFFQEKMYGNSGFWLAGNYTYLAEDPLGNIGLHEWHHQPDLNLDETPPKASREARRLVWLVQMIWSPKSMFNSHND